MKIPDDDNGKILQGLIEHGDNLSRERNIEFFHIFSDRISAVKFALAVDEIEYTVSISYYEERKMWDATVMCCMIPLHSEINRIEESLGKRAQENHGRSDGWQSQVILEKD